MAALVVVVIVAYAALFEPEREGTTTEPSSPTGAQVGKYEQTWTKDYDATTCADFVQQMDDHERWVTAAHYLLEAHRLGNPDLSSAPDAQVDLMSVAMHEACEAIAGERTIRTDEVATSLMATRADLQLLSSEAATIVAAQTSKPTPAPTPTRRPTPRPTPQPSGFGSRTAVVGFIEGLGFTGSMSNLADGRQRWLGRHRDGHMAEVIGTPDHITELSLTTAISDSIASGGETMGRFLARFAPGSTDWVADNLMDAILGDSPSRRFGDVRASLNGLAATDGGLVIVSLER